MNTVAQRAASAVIEDRARQFMGLAICQAGFDGPSAKAAFEARFPGSRLAEQRITQRTAIAPGRTDGATWGGELAELNQAASAFLALYQTRTVVGRLIGLRRVPLNVKVPRQTAGATVAWADQEGPAIVTAPGFDQVEVNPAKMSAIVVVSKELAKFSDPRAQSVIEQDLLRGAAAFEDEAFLNPAIAAVGQSPASILNLAPSFSATGTSEAALKADLRTLVGELAFLGSTLDSVALVMSKKRALAISQMEVGRDLGVNGGRLCGLDVVTTNSAALSLGGSPESDIIALIDPTQILLADEGVDFDIARHADVQMNSTPDSPATASTVMVGLWQRNLVGIKLTRFVRLEAANPWAAVYLTGCAYAE